MMEQITLTQDPPHVRYPQPTGLRYEGKDQTGKRILIDAAELSPDVYEIMALRPGSGAELDSKTAHSMDDAKTIYEAMLSHYTSAPVTKTAQPLTGKYAQLRDDLAAALAAGLAVEDADPEDGGTSNHDSAALRLPRWNADKIQQAAKEAGTGCFTWTLFGSKLYVFTPKTKGQGNARSRNAEAMTAALRALGYDATDYCQMD